MKKERIHLALAILVGIAIGAFFAQSRAIFEEPHAHNHRGGETVQVAVGEEDPQLSLEMEEDSVSGYNLHLMTKNFTFAPQNAGKEHKDGQGHAHVYVNGEKVARLYGEWAHITLPVGENEIEVTLNANDHREYADRFGVPIVVKETITVEPMEEEMEDTSMIME